MDNASQNYNNNVTINTIIGKEKGRSHQRKNSGEKNTITAVDTPTSGSDSISNYNGTTKLTAMVDCTITTTTSPLTPSPAKKKEEVIIAKISGGNNGIRAVDAPILEINSTFGDNVTTTVVLQL